jgi:hypothetical protein
MGKKGRQRPAYAPPDRPWPVHEPRVEGGTSRADHPSWLLQRLDLAGPWSWTRIDAAALRRVRERLGHLEALSFTEILGRVHHEIPAAQLCREARERLRDLRLDDFEHLLSLRILKRQRVWGARTAEGVLLLWWDPDHTVYPVDVTGN